MANELTLSAGQAFISPDRRRHRSSMALQLSASQAQSEHGACAVIADSPWRNAIARQASDLAVRGFLADYYSTPLDWNIKHAATRVLLALNNWCFSQSRFVSSGSYVSSFSVLIMVHDQAHLFHAGDTQVYRLRGTEFEQLTRDHVTDLGGYRYPSRALGMDASLELEYLNLPLAQGDLFLFTTNAMRGTLLPSDYVQLIRQEEEDLDAACARLAERAAEMAALRGLAADAFCFQLVRVERVGAPDVSASVSDNLPVPPALEVGDELDGYWIEEVLARNDKSRVYRVRDAVSGDRLLLKAPGSQLSPRSDYLQHFTHQRELLKRVRSPYVNHLEPLRRAPSHYYYLMHYVEGELLGDWIQRQSDASLTQRLEIGRQMIKAIDALHRRDIIHQGIHPDCFIVDEHGQVVLIDFSACCSTDTQDNEARALAREAGLTEFTAPEYFLNDEIGKRSDQFSLASVIYWLISYSEPDERGGRGRQNAGRDSTNGGHLPYGRSLSFLQDKRELEELAYSPLMRMIPDIPVVLDQVLARALSPRRFLRFRRLSELLIGLRRADASSVTSQPVTSIWRQERIWQVITVVLIIALIATWLLHV